MSHITAHRTYFNDCTYSRVKIADHEFQCFLLELPWLGNKQNESCIPEGVYEYEVKESPSRGVDVIWINDVKGRTNIQWHVGNFTRQIDGCGLPGAGIAFIDSDSIPDVTQSQTTFLKLLDSIDRKGTIRFVEQHKAKGVFDVG